ncbi:phosphoribosyltransferase family protein [Streptomyces sp. NPDC006879]|uniref:phosphoribosyltransferase family protein n=1 Tax=Streptomyces sp. NPDC006879 TaxID=3364767 RepID=UPI00368828BB
MFFVDRRDAGRQLAARLKHLSGLDVVVLGLPRGGVPVAEEVAGALGATLDVCLVRKLGAPFQPELAMGAIGEGSVHVINEEVVRAAHISGSELASAEARERKVLEARARRYRGGREPIRLDGRTVLVVDDGVATGSTARAACQIARARGATRVVLAVPVAPHDWTARLGADADEFLCLHAPRNFYAVGQFYADFSQIDDDEVIACLEESLTRPVRTRRRAAGRDVPEDREVGVRTGSLVLRGQLTVPEDALGIVVFAHGSGSSQHSPRNRFVATGLNQARLGTLLFDLLTEEEELHRVNVFDTGLLARRLTNATGWLREQPEAQGRPTGYFGASTGAAAALWAAAEPAARIAAVVSRGGRPDLAGDRLPAVAAPTLLIVGELDRQVLDLNRTAQARLRCEEQLVVVPGATHLFEEPGALDEVTDLARSWFVDHMATAARPAPRP